MLIVQRLTTYSGTIRKLVVQLFCGGDSTLGPELPSRGSIHCAASRVTAKGIEKMFEIVKTEQKRNTWLEDK